MRNHALRAGWSRPLAIAIVLTLGFSVWVLPPAEAQDLPGSLYSVSGTVFSADGKVLQEATVVLRKAGESATRQATADAQGRFSIDQLSAGLYNLSAAHLCCTTGFQQVSIGGTTVERSGVDFHLALQDPPRSGQSVNLRGLVHHAQTGDPVPRALLMISNWYQPGSGPSDRPAYDVDGGYQWFETISGEDGRYSINVNPGRVDVYLDHADFDYARGHFVVEADRVLDVPMRQSNQALATLSGVVRSTGGTPIPDAWVEVSPDYRSRCDGGHCYDMPEPMYGYGSEEGDGFWYESRVGRWASTSTDRDGRFQLRVAPGDLLVRAYHWDGYLPAEQRVQAQEGKNVTVNLALEPIPPDSVRVTGRIVDAQDGAPVPFAHVTLENQNWGHYNWTQTGQDGRFEVWTKPGHSILQVSAWRHYWAPCEGYAEPVSDDPQAPSSSPVAPRHAPSCERQEREHDYYPRIVTIHEPADGRVTLDLRLLRAPEPDAEFLGWVVNATSQQGVAGAIVTFYNERTRDWGQAITDEDGSYRIEVHAGYYTVRVWAEGYFDGALNTEIAAKKTQRLDLELEPGQKRYSYGGCCYYPMMARAASDGPDAPGAPQPGGMSSQETVAGSDGAFAGAEGRAAYEGSGGGLGPYSRDAKIDAGGGAPGLGLLALLAALGTAIVLSRRRSG